MKLTEKQIAKIKQKINIDPDTFIIRLEVAGDKTVNTHDSTLAIFTRTVRPEEPA